MQTFKIPSFNLPRLKSEIEQLNQRAIKLKLPTVELKIHETISEKINDQSLRSDDYLNCVHPILGAILLNDETFFYAMTADRAWFDSLEMPQQINLKQLAQISMSINGKMIAEYFGN